MKKMLFIPVLLFLVSCQEKELPSAPPRLVVEGWIENGGHPMVTVTRTMNVVIGEELDAGDIVHNIIRRAKVTVSDGVQTWQLEGGIDTDVFPPYRYSTDAFTGEVGKTYTLRVEYQDYVVTGEATIPEPVPIDRVYVKEVVDGKGTLACAFTDPAASGNYYKVFTKTKGKDGDYIPTAFGMVADEDLSNPEAEIFIFNNMRVMQHYARPNIEEGDVVSVKLRTLTQEGYRMWDAHERRVTGTSFSLRPHDTDEVTNLTGGLGYWVGYGASEPVTVKVE
ncbi:MAG: DUF4249 domain-containing protein [Bacteroidales bacterium]|nr:DUF4249 domain-containing protein [Bacteroidales bacterium]